MSLLDVLRSGVKTADNITKSFQGAVSYQRCTAIDATGTKTLAGAQTLYGIIDMTRQQIRTKEGTYLAVSATIDFLDVAAINTATSGNGFNVEDVFTLPDGKTRPTLSVRGFVDAGTTHPVVSTVMLG